MDEKREYKAPEIEIVSFDDDIIVTSSSDTTTPARTITSGFSLY